MSKFIDLMGQRFGKLTVLKRAKNRGKQTMWTVQCSCPRGTIKDVSASSLKNGDITRLPMR